MPHRKVLTANEFGLNPNEIHRLSIRGGGAIVAGDNRLLIRFNDSVEGYHSFTHAGGHYGDGEWEHSGIYVGRNGWNFHADFHFEFLVDVRQDHRRCGWGMSTFGHHPENQIIGYRCHGFWAEQHDVITEVSLWTSNGGDVADGYLTVRAA